MPHIHIIGVDPGLVHTGLVRLLFYTKTRQVEVEHQVITGSDVAFAKNWVHARALPTPHGWIENYRPRGSLRENTDMVNLVKWYEQRLKFPLLDNTGVTKVVKRPLMQMLKVWDFSTPTHHQDLRSAARIALLGMLKDDELNTVLADFVRDSLNGDPWEVSTL